MKTRVVICIALIVSASCTKRQEGPTKASTPGESEVNAQLDDLITAADKGNLPRVKALLAARVDVNATGDLPDIYPLTKTFGGTPLRHGFTALLAASQNGNSEMVRALLGAKANVNKGNEVGITPLMMASMFGHLQVVQTLLEARAEVNAEAGSTTSLSAAADNGHVDVVALLLSAGARQDTISEFVAHSDNADVVKLLVDAGANKKAREYLRKVALLSAAENGRAEVVKLLLDDGANKEVKDEHGVSYTKDGHIWISYYDDPSIMNINLATPLIWAAMNGHADVVKLLLDAGASKEAKDHWGHTALMAAEWYGHGDVVKLLLDAGAKEPKKRDLRQAHGPTYPVPTYPGASVEATGSSATAEASRQTFGLTTSDSVDKVITFYQDQLKKNGFTVVQPTTIAVGGQAVTGTVIGDSPDRRRHVQIFVQLVDKKTKASISVAEDDSRH